MSADNGIKSQAAMKVLKNMMEATGSSMEDCRVMLSLCSGDPNRATEQLLSSPFEVVHSKHSKKQSSRSDDRRSEVSQRGRGGALSGSGRERGRGPRGDRDGPPRGGRSAGGFGRRPGPAFGDSSTNGNAFGDSEQPIPSSFGDVKGQQADAPAPPPAPASAVGPGWGSAPGSSGGNQPSMADRLRASLNPPPPSAPPPQPKQDPAGAWPSICKPPQTSPPAPAVEPSPAPAAAVEPQIQPTGWDVDDEAQAQPTGWDVDDEPKVQATGWDVDNVPQAAPKPVVSEHHEPEPISHNPDEQVQPETYQRPAASAWGADAGKSIMSSLTAAYDAPQPSHDQMLSAADNVAAPPPSHTGQYTAYGSAPGIASDMTSGHDVDAMQLAFGSFDLNGSANAQESPHASGVDDFGAGFGGAAYGAEEAEQGGASVLAQQHQEQPQPQQPLQQHSLQQEPLQVPPVLPQQQQQAPEQRQQPPPPPAPVAPPPEPAPATAAPAENLYKPSGYSPYTAENKIPSAHTDAPAQPQNPHAAPFSASSHFSMPPYSNFAPTAAAAAPKHAVPQANPEAAHQAFNYPSAAGFPPAPTPSSQPDPLKSPNVFGTNPAAAAYGMPNSMYSAVAPSYAAPAAAPAAPAATKFSAYSQTPAAAVSSSDAAQQAVSSGAAPVPMAPAAQPAVPNMYHNLMNPLGPFTGYGMPPYAGFNPQNYMYAPGFSPYNYAQGAYPGVGSSYPAPANAPYSASSRGAYAPYPASTPAAAAAATAAATGQIPAQPYASSAGAYGLAGASGYEDASALTGMAGKDKDQAMPVGMAPSLAAYQGIGAQVPIASMAMGGFAAPPMSGAPGAAAGGYGGRGGGGLGGYPGGRGGRNNNSNNQGYGGGFGGYNNNNRNQFMQGGYSYGLSGGKY